MELAKLPESERYRLVDDFYIENIKKFNSTFVVCNAKGDETIRNVKQHLSSIGIGFSDDEPGNDSQLNY